ncbi:flagellar hook-associated protein FlgK [Paraliobacillus sediminis]|uniref:flagellar hook-associated protein FlgK n=1 Tax=Paraliobacillus sediminis TaxID=1885916 RepID=UPI000E3BD821|nr:flagellar hook-associated protein FlgK [Paraliobacillus sediminis]
MVSTFSGLETARRALSTQQAALYTTSHNIANANTEGYTRQRVNFEQVSTLSVSRYTEGVKSNIGSGVQAGSIERIRERFLDVQYRNQTSKSGYYEQRAAALSQMESIINEPTESGLANSMEEFWNSLEDLSTNPASSGTRAVVAQNGQAVAESFNYINQSLQEVRSDLKNQIDITTKDFNSLVDQINSLNKEIAGIEPHGHVPNDLYDERDRLIDSLSSIADISVEYNSSGGQPNPIAEGIATVTLNINDTGDTKVTLIDGDTGSVNHLQVGYNESNVETLTFTDPEDPTDTTPVNSFDFKSTGELQGLMEMNGYTDGTTVEGYYNEILTKLDTMATEFADAFNATHQAGTDFDGDPGEVFFEYDPTSPASSLTVNETILDDPNKIAASLNGDAGDGSNALNLVAVFDAANVGLDGSSVKGYYESIIGDIGVVARKANTMVSNTAVLKQQVSENRDSVSAVSLDEEMTNMIKFQHAYNAAARSMTAVDEMLDRIINNMGLVGR